MNLIQWTSKRILELCKEANITPNKLGTISGITQSTLNSIIKCEHKSPRLDTIIKICIALNMDIRDFFDEEFEEVDIDS